MCVFSGGRANDIAHFHAASRSMKAERRGLCRRNTQFPASREIDKIHQQQWQAHTHGVYVIFWHCPLIPRLCSLPIPDLLHIRFTRRAANRSLSAIWTASGIISKSSRRSCPGVSKWLTENVGNRMVFCISEARTRSLRFTARALIQFDD